MSHSIYGQRFYSFRVPAWHHLGQVLDEQLTALQALQLVGQLDITKLPIKVVLPDGTLVDAPDFKMITRFPTLEDDHYEFFNVVSEEYTLPTQTDVCASWDKSTGAKLQTLGMLAGGSILFMCTDLPSITVGKEDKIDMHLILSYPMDGIHAAKVLRSPVRVVCQNTLSLAESLSVEQFSVQHRPSLLEDLEYFLGSVYETSVDKVAVIQEAFNILNDTPVKGNDVDYLIESVYPDPIIPVKIEAITDRRFESMQANYNALVEKTKARRMATVELYNGKAAGFELMQGTAWGFYNSVAELENYRRSRGNEARAYSVLFNDRATTIAKAFDVAYEYAKG